MLVGLYPVVVSCKENSFALAVVLWLNNKSFRLPIVELFFKQFNICGEHPSLREKFELGGEVFLHREQVSGQQILPGHSVHTWEVVCALIGLHPL
jgi:hypothetical protein